MKFSIQNIGEERVLRGKKRGIHGVPLFKCCTFFLRPGIRQECPGLPLLFTIVLKVSDDEIKCLHTGEELKNVFSQK